MILKTDGEIEAFMLGMSIGARLPMQTVRTMYRYIKPGYNTDDRALPWSRHVGEDSNA